MHVLPWMCLVGVVIQGPGVDQNENMLPRKGASERGTRSVQLNVEKWVILLLKAYTSLVVWLLTECSTLREGHTYSISLLSSTV
jgi:hypothetical protein